MSAATRPSRRAATRRNAVIESDDEDVANTTKIREDDEEDFKPEPAAASRRTTRGRKSMAAAPAAAPAPRTRGRPKKTDAPAPPVEPSEEPDMDVTIQPKEEVESSAENDIENNIKNEPKTPEKKLSPRKRKSVAPRASLASTADLAPPTPRSPISPEATRIHESPLADMTASSINTVLGPDDTQATVKPIRPMDSIMEKPVDIVLKSRTMVVPFVVESAPKSRIVLTHLILNNFKSYAGTQEVGPFHASFSSVVGPNGSGKSNVIDSLLFVFGFRASKMRQGKISALIHNSAQHPNLEFCEVSVHFQEVMDLVSRSDESIQYHC